MSDSLITKKAIAQCLKNLAAEKSFLKISKTINTEGCGNRIYTAAANVLYTERKRSDQFQSLFERHFYWSFLL